MYFFDKIEFKNKNVFKIITDVLNPSVLVYIIDVCL